jgi:hypothetical protein
MLTVIVPHRAGRRPEWTAERVESHTALGVRVKLDGKETLVAFRQAGASGTATLADARLDGQVVVRQP